MIALLAVANLSVLTLWCVLVLHYGREWAPDTRSDLVAIGWCVGMTLIMVAPVFILVALGYLGR